MEVQNAEYLTAAYHGSRFFQFLGDAIGFQIDRVNFILTQLFALLLALCYRWFLNYDKYSYNTRLLGTLLPGFLLSAFCYGTDLYHLVLLTVFSYLATIFSDPKHVHKVVMVVAIGYMSKLHLLRMYYDYGGYVLDITGPVMIAVQKVTSLGFSLHDGTCRKDSELTEEQRKFALRRKPTPLEYFAYTFSFQTLMCGPLVYYTDFIDFIDGTNFKQHVPAGQKNPSPGLAVIKKLATSTFFAICVVTVVPIVTHERLADDEWLASVSWLWLVIYMTIALTAARFKYFFAWILGETICNASGLGFAGYDKSGNADWDLVSNVDIWRLETAPSFKVLLDNWNKSTQSWLRRYAYERTKKQQILLTYILSALWHGFYPGYYLCFLTAALITTAGRTGRRCLRPIFKGEKASPAIGYAYDCVTCILAHVSIAYACAPFVLLSFSAGFKIYKNMYFFEHILCLLAIFVLPIIVPPQRSTRPVKTKPVEEATDESVKLNEEKKAN